MKRIFDFIKDKMSDLSKKLKVKALRDPDDLFKSGDVFKATEEELRNILKEASVRTVPNELVRHREIVRTLVVNNIQNQRHIDKIDNRNFVLTLMIVILTIISVLSARKLENYIELSTRAERITQEQSVQNAIARCKESPDLKESGIYNTETGAPATCTDVLKIQ